MTPVVSDDSDSPMEYQASSPDEIALVKFAEEVGCKLVYRDQLLITLKNPVEHQDNYEVLLDFPFTSESKRMGIVVKKRETQEITFYIKGAESVICTKVPKTVGSNIREATEILSLEGLRTLAFAKKELSLQEYSEWRRRYDIACAAEVNREAMKMTLREELEVDMQYIGVTGVEDTLQRNVAIAVEGLKQAGIKVWMLTGDKVETACCIGISSGFKSKTEKYVDLKHDPDFQGTVITRLRVGFGSDG